MSSPSFIKCFKESSERVIDWPEQYQDAEIWMFGQIQMSSYSNFHDIPDIVVSWMSYYNEEEHTTE